MEKNNIYKYRNEKLESLLSTSNDPAAIKSFREHYSSFRPVLDQIYNNDKPELFNVVDHVDFLKKDMHNLVIDKGICLAEERDIFILDNFNKSSIHPSPKLNLDIIEHSKILEKLNCSNDSLDAIMFDFNKSEYISKIKNLSTKTVDIVNIEKHPNYESVRQALAKLIETFDSSHIDFLTNLAENYETFLLVTLEPYIALVLGGTLFMKVIGSLHIKGSFKKIVIDLITLRKNREYVRPSLTKKILTYLLRLYNDFSITSLTSSITNVKTFDKYLCNLMVIWLMQALVVVFSVIYIFSFFS